MLNVFLDIFAHSPVDYARVVHVCSRLRLIQLSVFQCALVEDRISDEMANMESSKAWSG